MTLQSSSLQTPSNSPMMGRTNEKLLPYGEAGRGPEGPPFIRGI